MKYISSRWIGSNRGDLLSRYGVLSALRKNGYDDILVVCKEESHVPFGFPTIENGNLYNLFLPLTHFRAFFHARFVLFIAGLDLQDDSSLVKLIHVYLVFLSYRMLGLKIFVLMQGAGPITTRWGKIMTRMILNTIDTLIVRDSKSMDLLESLNRQTKLIKGFDGIFAGQFDGKTPDKESAVVSSYSSKAPTQPLIGFNLRRWFHFGSSVLPYQFSQSKYTQRSHEKMTEFVQASTNYIQMLREQLDARVVLISMYEQGPDPWEDDLPLLQEIKAQEAFANDKDVVIADYPLSLPGFCDLISKLDVMVGARLHSTLTALRFNVPAINLNYTLKGRAIYSDLGFDNLVIELDDFIANPRQTFELTVKVLGGNPSQLMIADKIEKIIAENENILLQAFQADSKEG